MNRRHALQLMLASSVGIGALTRIVGFLILAIGVELVVHGILDITH